MTSLDTIDEAARVQAEVWRSMGGSKRLEVALRMSDEARDVARDGIRARHPGYGEHDVEHALRRMLLGDELFRAAWPDAPLLDP
ncbi:MAG: hypothetical protein ACQEXJ_18525 [Myxococcota bacterium]